MFTDNFDKYALPGETITCEKDGYTLTATIHHDHDSHIDDNDCHNPDQSVTGCNDEQFAKLMAAREAWERNEWFFCGIVISAERNGVHLNDHAASLWGIECNYPDTDNTYLRDVANDLLGEAIERAEYDRMVMRELLRA